MLYSVPKLICPGGSSLRAIYFIIRLIIHTGVRETAVQDKSRCGTVSSSEYPRKILSLILSRDSTFSFFFFRFFFFHGTPTRHSWGLSHWARTALTPGPRCVSEESSPGHLRENLYVRAVKRSFDKLCDVMRKILELYAVKLSATYYC